MLGRLLSLIAALTLACASAHTHANAHLPQPETAHRAFAAIEETASRAEALLAASDIKANCHPQEICASVQRGYANNSPYKFTDPDGRDAADRAYGAAVGFMLRNNPEMLATWAAGEAAATTEGSAAEAGAGMGLAIGDFVDKGDFSKQAVAGVAVKAMVMAVTKGKTHTTYTRTKSDGTVYSGRTRGTGTAEQQVLKRTSQPDHKAKTAEGYGPAVVDKNSANAAAIRGREQQLIEQNGGAQSQGGTSGNAINGISPSNAKGDGYRQACSAEFGC